MFWAVRAGLSITTQDTKQTEAWMQHFSAFQVYPKSIFLLELRGHYSQV
jgi:hypothetical protein